MNSNSEAIGRSVDIDSETSLTLDQIKILEAIREIQLEIIQEIQRICELEKLNYFLMFGTLLGAVRHQGFIPWDDDVDLGMMRKDYELFIKAFDKHAAPEYEIQSLETDDFYPFFFLKVLKKNTILIEGGYQDDRKMNGIFVDVFPFDNAPSNLFILKVHNKITIFFKSLLFYQLGRMDTNQGNLFVRTVKKGKNLLAKIMSRKQIISVTNWIMRIFKKEGPWVSNFGDAVYYPRELFIDFEPIKFESHEFQAPTRSTEFLQTFYGDYMKLPPMHQRSLPHDIISVTIDGRKILWV